MKAGVLFSGGEGVGCGLREAGVAHAWGIELDDAIAQVARDNGFNVLTADVTQCNPADFTPVDWLHASPPCINASLANSSSEINEEGTKETEGDKELARAVCRFVEAKLPRIFTLENVFFYRKFKSFAMIQKTLLKNGYAFNHWHVNMADYGVPQTRKRLILIARRDGVRPSLPPATHAQNPTPGLFGTLPKWVGWYEAIADLLPTLPDSQFAPWQLERLPEEMKEAVMVNGSNTGWARGYDSTGPAFTVNASVSGKESRPKALLVEGRNQNGGRDAEGDEPAQSATTSHPPRALLVDSAGYPDGEGARVPVQRGADEPTNTVVANHERRPMRAFLTDGKNAGQEWGTHYREADEPANVVTAVQRPAHLQRAFLAPGANSSSFAVRSEDEPSRVVGDTERVGNVARAFIIDGKLSSSGGAKVLQTHAADEPHGTVVASSSPLRDGRAIAQGRVVQMTPRALARFQSFPDWYVLPDNKILACRVIGNAVPPLFMQRLAEWLIASDGTAA